MHVDNLITYILLKEKKLLQVPPRLSSHRLWWVSHPHWPLNTVPVFITSHNEGWHSLNRC